mgnify:CR=1 FL=1
MRREAVIAVTGASRGIGATIALELARRGFTVACLTRNGTGPEVAIPSELSARFVNARCDVTDEASIKQALAEIAAKAGAIHGLVNNAGIHLDGPSDKLPLDIYNQVMATNATAVFAACREVFPHLTKAGGGIIINMATSAAMRWDMAGYGAYGAVKQAIRDVAKRPAPVAAIKAQARAMVAGMKWEELTPNDYLRAEAKALRREVHLVLKQVSHDYERMQYNTVVSG